MSVVTVDAGQNQKSIDRLKISDGLGSFTAIAAAATPVTDASVSSTSQIVIFPTNGPAGLLLRSKSCYVTAGSGSFTFNVSASGAGAPAATETFGYIALDES